MRRTARDPGAADADPAVSVRDARRSPLPARPPRRHPARRVRRPRWHSPCAPVYACRPDLGPPGAPTPWPPGAARQWRWQWQLTGPVDTTVDADVVLLDPVRVSTAETGALRGGTGG